MDVLELVPSTHLEGIKSITEDPTLDVLGLCITDVETKTSEILINPQARDRTLVLLHEVGHHVLARYSPQLNLKVLQQEQSRYARAKECALDVLLTSDSLEDFEEFFADAYAIWVLFPQARPLFRENFPGTAGILSQLFRESKHDIIKGEL